MINLLPKPLTQALSNHKEFTKALFERPESLGALLPYSEYLEADSLFLQKDGSLGAIFEATLLEHETMTSEQVVSSVESLKSWFNLPSNCTLQILFDQAPISEHDPEFEKIETYFKNRPDLLGRFFYLKNISFNYICKNFKENIIYLNE